MFYTWSGESLAYLQLYQLWKCLRGSNTGQKNEICPFILPLQFFINWSSSWIQYILLDWFSSCKQFNYSTQFTKRSDDLWDKMTICDKPCTRFDICLSGMNCTQYDHLCEEKKWMVCLPKSVTQSPRLLLKMFNWAWAAGQRIAWNHYLANNGPTKTFLWPLKKL